MYVCTLYVCMFVCMYVCTLYVCMFVCMYVCMYIVCMYVHCTYVYMYIVCMYVYNIHCMYVCMYIVCVYVCTLMHKKTIRLNRGMMKTHLSGLKDHMLITTSDKLTSIHKSVLLTLVTVIVAPIPYSGLLSREKLFSR